MSLRLTAQPAPTKHPHDSVVHPLLGHARDAIPPCRGTMLAAREVADLMPLLEQQTTMSAGRVSAVSGTTPSWQPPGEMSTTFRSARARSGERVGTAIESDDSRRRRHLARNRHGLLGECPGVISGPPDLHDAGTDVVDPGDPC